MRHFVSALIFLSILPVVIAEPSARDRALLLEGASLMLGEWKCRPSAGVHPFTARISWNGARGFELAWLTGDTLEPNVYELSSHRKIATQADAYYKSYMGQVERTGAERPGFRIEILLFKPAVWTDVVDATAHFEFGPESASDELRFKIEMRSRESAGPSGSAEALRAEALRAEANCSRL